MKVPPTLGTVHELSRRHQIDTCAIIELHQHRHIDFSPNVFSRRKKKVHRSHGEEESTAQPNIELRVFFWQHKKKGKISFAQCLLAELCSAYFLLHVPSGRRKSTSDVFSVSSSWCFSSPLGSCLLLASQ